MTAGNSHASNPIFWLLFLFVSLANASISNAVTVNELRCEYLDDPLGIDEPYPRLSWIMHSAKRGDAQTAYHILVASSPAILSQNEGDLWDSGTVNSSQSVQIAYAGKALASGMACYWKVQIHDKSGNASNWSPSASWTMGLLQPEDWTAQWIGMAAATNISPAAPSPMFRKCFNVSKPVARATAYICGLGYYELQINGVKIGNHVLDPSWTRYDRHAEYVTFDVTTNLVTGTNAIGVQLANGFYNQWIPDAWNTYTAPWRALPQMVMQLDIQYADGNRDRIISDTSWKCSTGPLVLDATRLGETYDARLEKLGWSSPRFDDSTWTAAVLREGIAGNLIAPDAEPVNVFQNINAVKIIPALGKPGVYTFDFGQNLVGWGKLNINAPAGTRITMIYGELTNADGLVNQSNINVYVKLANYFQTDTYITKGSQSETYTPRFTYHGFRYAQVMGLMAPPTANTLIAQVIHTAFQPSGTFYCANDLLNRIETNAVRSYLGNFVGIPTDCPHREKNGWLGDAQLACELGLTHFDSAAAYTRWLREFKIGQLPNGKLCGVLPNAIWSYDRLDGPAWESAALLIPWQIYQHCGDIRVLTNNYYTMKAYTDYCTSLATNHIVSYGLGDWEPAKTKTPASVTDTAYYYQDALIVARTAALMGKVDDSVQYSNLAAQIKTSFNATFFNPTTQLYAHGSQTAESCALYQQLVDSNYVSAVASQLVARVKQNGDRIDTGILGSKYLLRALCDNGYSDTALTLACQTNYPSWGNWVVRGATTLWETWSGRGPRDSLNHVMFGDISAWFIEYIAGIRPGSPGYRTVIIKPEITGTLAWAMGTHNSPYGVISNSWQINKQNIRMNVIIPPNSTAIVYLPALRTPTANLLIEENGIEIYRKGQTTGNDPGVTFDGFERSGEQTYAVCKVASGHYQFKWNISLTP